MEMGRAQYVRLSTLSKPKVFLRASLVAGVGSAMHIIMHHTIVGEIEIYLITKDVSKERLLLLVASYKSYKRLMLCNMQFKQKF